MVSISCRVGESNSGDCKRRSSSSVETILLGGERIVIGISLEIVEIDDGLNGVVSTFTVVVNSLSKRLMGKENITILKAVEY